MKKQLLLLVMMLLPMVVWAYAVNINGIYYNLSGSTAEVTSHPNKYSGSIVIPSSVTYGTNNYTVTGIGNRAFYDCTQLTELTIPSSITYIGDTLDPRNAYVFDGCNEYVFKKVKISDLEAWCKITFADNSYANPLKKAHHLYLNESEITDLVIPNTITTLGTFQFESCYGITSLTIPSTVTNLGLATFYDCRNLTTVNIAPGLTTIGVNMFLWCEKLTSINIPNTVTTIQNGAFGNTGLTSIEIPNSVTSIEYCAFQVCKDLTSITIPNSVTSIGNYAFVECKSLTSIDIPNSVTSIGDGAFSQCYGLTSVTIPNSVTSIGKSTFAKCSGLTSFTIPNSVTSIGNSAFEGCINLTFVKIPSSVTYIGTSAFWDCSKLATVHSLIETPFILSENVFNNYSNTVLVVPTGTIDTYKSTVGWKNFQTIKEYRDDHEFITFVDAKVKEICVQHWDSNDDGELSKFEAEVVGTVGDFFKDDNTITSFNELQYFTCLQSIGENAFNSCSGLTSIKIPDSVTSIGNGAFSGCEGLISIDIPNSVTNIGDEAFNCCFGLTSVTIGNSVKSIGEGAFYYCIGLTTVTIPNSVTSIGGYAFADINISTVISLIENPFKIIGQPSGYSIFSPNTFNNATLYVPKGTIDKYRATEGWKDFNNIIEGKPAVKDNITFADANVKAICVQNWDTDGDDELSKDEAAAVTDLGDAFKNNTTITSFDELQYFTGLTTIAKNAFYGCTELKKLIIPNTVTSIGESAFCYCSELTAIEIPTSVTSIGRVAFGSCIKLISIEIPNSVTNIGDGVFWCCSDLASATIGNSVTSLDGVFGGCSSLTSIVIPNSVTSIGYRAFTGCSSLTSVTIPNSVTSIGADAFSDCGSLTSIEIPNSVTNIGENAFNGSGLISIEIHKSLTSIGDWAFSWCSALKSISVDADNTIYDSRGGCNAIIRTADNTLIAGCSETIIPNSVTTVGDGAFSGRIGITSILIPNSVTNIGRNAFCGCTGLTSVTFGNSVTSIDIFAFKDCTGLSEIQSFIEQPFTIWDNVFWSWNETDGTNDKTLYENIKLYVPKGKVDAYKATDGWKNFKNILEMADATDVSTMSNVIYIESMEEMCGTQATISLKMKNTAAIRGFQFDLYLPEGVTVVKSSKGRIQGFLSEGRLPDEDEHSLTFSEQADGAIRFLCSSQYDETFTGNDGEIATLRVNIAEDMADGDYPLLLKNIKLTETDISKYYETPLVKCKLTIKSYTLGDINSDGTVDVSDYTGVANHIHGDTPQGFVVKAGDVDGSGTIDVSDYTGIANIIHTGSIYGNSSSRAMSRSPKKVNTDISDNNNVIYIEPFAVTPGTPTTISFKMKNTAEIRGFQFDLYLPEGVTVVKSPKGRIQGALSAGRLPEDDEHDLTFSEQADGAIRFLCSSQYDETFTGNDGEIATLQVTVAENMADGNYPVLLKKVKLTETDISKFYVTEEVETTMSVLTTAEIKKGDVTGDGYLTSADVTALVDYILGRGTLANEAAAYVNDDTKIDIQDVAALIGLIKDM